MKIASKLRQLLCRHDSRETMTRTLIESGRPAVVSRTHCCDCGKLVPPLQPIPPDVIQSYLVEAALMQSQADGLDRLADTTWTRQSR